MGRRRHHLTTFCFVTQNAGRSSLSPSSHTVLYEGLCQTTPLSNPVQDNYGVLTVCVREEIHLVGGWGGGAQRVTTLTGGSFAASFAARRGRGRLSRRVCCQGRQLRLRSANAEPNAESCCGRQSHPEDDITASGAENIPLRTEATQCFPWPLLIYFVVGGRLGVGGQALPILTTDR